MSELRARSRRASSFSQQELIARPGEPQRAAGLGYPYSHCSVYVNPPAGVEMLADSNCRGSSCFAPARLCGRSNLLRRKLNPGHIGNK